MASLYIEEFQGVGQPQQARDFIGSALATALLPSISQPVITITGSSTPSVAFSKQTILIRVHCDAVCSVKVGGLTPVATVQNMRLAANQTEYFSVYQGEALAVIANV
jgi:hypothetical protein